MTFELQLSGQGQKFRAYYTRDCIVLIAQGQGFMAVNQPESEAKPDCLINLPRGRSSDS